MTIVEVIVLAGDKVAEVGAEVIAEFEIDVDVVQLVVELKKSVNNLKIVGSEWKAWRCLPSWGGIITCRTTRNSIVCRGAGWCRSSS